MRSLFIALLLTSSLVLAVAPEKRFAKTGVAKESEIGLVEGVLVRGKEPYTGLAVGRYEDGSVKFLLEIKNGKLHGPMTVFHPGGAMMSHGIYIEDEQHGVWTGWGPNGEIMAQAEFKNGELLWKNTFEVDLFEQPAV